MRCNAPPLLLQPFSNPLAGQNVEEEEAAGGGSSNPLFSNPQFRPATRKTP